MKSTDTNAKSGMATYVVCIFAAALILAGVYFFVLTPGQPDDSNGPPVIESNEGAGP